MLNLKINRVLVQARYFRRWRKIIRIKKHRPWLFNESAEEELEKGTGNNLVTQVKVCDRRLKTNSSDVVTVANSHKNVTKVKGSDIVTKDIGLDFVPSAKVHETNTNSKDKNLIIEAKGNNLALDGKGNVEEVKVEYVIDADLKDDDLIEPVNNSMEYVKYSPTDVQHQNKANSQKEITNSSKYSNGNLLPDSKTFHKTRKRPAVDNTNDIHAVESESKVKTNYETESKRNGAITSNINGRKVSTEDMDTQEINDLLQYDKKSFIQSDFRAYQKEVVADTEMVILDDCYNGDSDDTEVIRRHRIEHFLEDAIQNLPNPKPTRPHSKDNLGSTNNKKERKQTQRDLKDNKKMVRPLKRLYSSDANKVVDDVNQKRSSKRPNDKEVPKKSSVVEDLDDIFIEKINSKTELSKTPKRKKSSNSVDKQHTIRPLGRKSESSASLPVKHLIVADSEQQLLDTASYGVCLQR